MHLHRHHQHTHGSRIAGLARKSPSPIRAYGESGIDREHRWETTQTECQPRRRAGFNGYELRWLRSTHTRFQEGMHKFTESREKTAARAQVGLNDAWCGRHCAYGESGLDRPRRAESDKLGDRARRADLRTATAESALPVGVAPPDFRKPKLLAVPLFHERASAVSQVSA